MTVKNIAELVLAELARKDERIKVTFGNAERFRWGAARDALDRACASDMNDATWRARYYLLGLLDGHAIRGAAEKYSQPQRSGRNKMTRPFKFEIGDLVQDEITGLNGTVVSLCRHATGCDRFCVQPPSEDGSKVADTHWCDESALEKTGESAGVRQVFERAHSGRGALGDPPRRKGP